MFSSLKKWVRNDENAQPKQQTPFGLQTMRSDLQKKFSKGVQYNLKIIIRGDRNSGKTCLWYRLQGQKFVEEYLPTPEIQATSIHWNYKATDDIVKVDVWDVVDKGKPKQSSNSLKLAHQGDSEDQCTLDASFLDVYKGAHAVLMLFDITKKWTYQYVEKELPKIPSHIPVLVLANHRDMGSHRVVDLYELQQLINYVERPAGSAGIFYVESSMKTGFGLKYIHKFFNLPFLLVQRESLLKQLETNHLDVESCLEELHYESTSDDHNYDNFLKAIQERQNQQKKAALPEQPAQNVNGQDHAPNTSNLPINNSIVNDKPASKSPPTTLKLPVDSPQDNSKDGGLFSPSMMADANISPDSQAQKEPEKKGFMSRFFRSSSVSKQEPQRNSSPDVPVIAHASTLQETRAGPVDIDKFVPEDEGTENFLNEAADNRLLRGSHDEAGESSSDSDAGNPMVAGFQEELDSDDQIPTATETHKIYRYSDSDDNYETSPRPDVDTTPISSRSHPQSRLTPKPKLEDSKLQHLQIESDVSDDDFGQPYIMPDANSISDDDIKQNDIASLEINEEKVTNEFDVKNLPFRKDSSDLEDSFATKVTLQPSGSSDEELEQPEVSMMVDDVPTDEDAHEISQSQTEKASKAPVKKLVFNLQSSDLDFLEQLTTSPEQVPSSSSNPRSSNKNSKKSKKHKESEGTKKHKHKKKKTKDSNHEVESKGGKKKSRKKTSEKKSAEDNALEEFLGGGEGYESL